MTILVATTKMTIDDKDYEDGNYVEDNGDYGDGWKAKRDLNSNQCDTGGGWCSLMVVAKSKKITMTIMAAWRRVMLTAIKVPVK